MKVCTKFGKRITEKIRLLNCLLVLVLLAMGHETACSQICNPDIKPVKDQIFGYRERNNDKRCEGFYQSPVAAGSIEVVGLVKGKFRFKWDKEEIVEISSPLVGDRPVYVCAMGIPIKTYYRMDAQILPGKKLRWPVGDVICPQKLYPKIVGIFGWIGTEAEKTSYVPVRAVGTGMNSVPGDDRINLYLRTSVDVELVKWRHHSDMTDASRPGQWKDTDKSRYRSGSPIRIILPPSETGELYVEVAAKEKGSARWLKKNLRVLAKEVKDDKDN